MRGTTVAASVLLVLAMMTQAARGADGGAAALAHVCSFGYVLQADALETSRRRAVRRLAASGRDLLILDPSYRGGEPWRIPDLEAMREAHRGRRVVAYLSIGEAEDYRSYWQPDWRVEEDGTRGKTTPDYLVAPNPNWPGNYKVRYWDRRWQAIILARLRTIVAAEFDGVYLDIVDAFQFFEHDPATDSWQSHRRNPATGRSYREDMQRWVGRIARQARGMRPGFLVIPQNGSELLASAPFVDLIDGIGIEDLRSIGDQAQSEAHTSSVLANLEALRGTGKPALLVEYTTDPALRRRIAAAVRGPHRPLLFTDRALTGLGTSPGC